MSSNFDLIKTFHERFPHSTAPLAEGLRIRSDIMTEEVREVCAALESLAQAQTAGLQEEQARAEAVKEIIDLMYVLYGTLHYLRVDADAAFAEVHPSNMSKTPNATGGKAIKGSDYKPADMMGLMGVKDAG